MTFTRILIATWCISGSAFVSPASAAPKLACPPKAYLTVDGPQATPRVFTEDEILKLPVATVTTSTVWNPRSAWTGPSLQTVLDAAGMKPGAKQIRVTALDNFESVIPLADLATYKPVLAHSLNAKQLKGSKYGPLYVVFPRDDHKELLNPAAEAKMVWAVCKLNVE